MSGGEGGGWVLNTMRNGHIRYTHQYLLERGPHTLQGQGSPHRGVFSLHANVH